MLEKNRVLHEAGQPPQDVYFLTEGLAMLSISGAKAKQLEMSIVGNEGIMGKGPSLKTGCHARTGGA
jgi:hypothetical protein